MKKQIFTILSLLMVSISTYATVLITPVNTVVDSNKTNFQLDVTGDGAYDITFNYFANGSITLTGRVGNGNSFFLATGTISGSNNYPVKIKNNQTFTNLTTWKSNSIFIQSPNLGYTDFKGKGNKYIGGRMQYTGMPEFFYFWILVNVSEDGSKLNIIKCAFESEPDVALATENEGIDENTNIAKVNLTSNSQFNFYPNPATDNITINPDFKIKSFAIFDINGAMVMPSNELTANKINLTNLPKGIYLLQVSDFDNRIYTQKLIIEKN